MARLPRKEDLKAIDHMLGDISTKLDNISRLGDVFKIDEKPWDDVATAIDRVAKVSDALARNLGAVARNGRKIKEDLAAELQQREKIQRLMEQAEDQAKDIAEQLKKNRDQQKKGLGILKDLKEEEQKLVQAQRDFAREVEHANEKLEKVEDNIDGLERKISELPTGFMLITKIVGQQLFTALDRVGKAILLLGIDSLFVGMQKIEVGVKRVYELFERWTKALGGLNIQIGSLSPNMQGFVTMAKQWEGEIRGLTDNFGEGLAMAQDFVKSFGRILEPSELSKWGKLGLQVARGLGVGGQAAGALLKSMYQLGQTPEEARGAFGEMVASANAAGISVNQFAGEVAEARGFMLQFGTVGQKVFIQAAARARQFGLSIRALQQLTDLTDTFDSATQAAAKLNTVFGTSINSLDLMLEQDPSRRLESVRQELLAQGKTYDKLSRNEIKFMSQTLQLSEEELAGVLKTGKSLDQFHRDQERAKAKQMKDDKLLRQAQMATAQTMFAFGQAFDNITNHIIKLIRPFTDLLGLTGEFDKDGKRINNTFGGVMSRIFGKLAEVIDAIASNQDFQDFIKSVAVDLKNGFEEVMKFLGDGKGKGLQGAISGAVDFVKMFYEGAKKAVTFLWQRKDGIIDMFNFLVRHSGKILAVWAGAKLAAGIFGTIQGIKGTIDLVSWATGSKGVMSMLSMFSGGLKAAAGSMLGKAGFVAAAGLAGWAIGRFIGDLEVGGKKIDDWVVIMFEAVADFGAKLWRSFKDSKVGELLGLKDSGTDLQKKMAISDEALARLHTQYFKITQGAASANQLKAFSEVAKAQGEDFVNLMSRSMGVSEDSVRAAITKANSGKVAAVTPPAPVIQKVETPSLDSDSAMAFGSAFGSGGVSGKSVLVAGDVYLDGKKIGKHLARQLLSDERG